MGVRDKHVKPEGAADSEVLPRSHEILKVLPVAALEAPIILQVILQGGLQASARNHTFLLLFGFTLLVKNTTVCNWLDVREKCDNREYGLARQANQ